MEKQEVLEHFKNAGVVRCLHDGETYKMEFKDLEGLNNHGGTFSITTRRGETVVLSFDGEFAEIIYNRQEKRILNPIIGNRLVCDYTFATRLLSLATFMRVVDACSEDERESFISYATKLLSYQVKTATDPEEIKYLERVNAKQRIKG